MIKTQHCPNCEATEQKLHDFKQKVSDICGWEGRFLDLDHTTGGVDCPKCGRRSVVGLVNGGASIGVLTPVEPTKAVIAREDMPATNNPMEFDPVALDAIKKNKCEICQMPAAVAVRDVSRKGQEQMHYYCPLHGRPATSY